MAPGDQRHGGGLFLDAMKPRWRIALILIALVLVSGFVGALIGARIQRQKSWRRTHPEAWNINAMRTLEQHLHFVPAQKDKVQAILDGGVVELREVRSDTIVKTNAILDRLIEQVDREADAEQHAGVFSSSKASARRRTWTCSTSSRRIRPRRPRRIELIAAHPRNRVPLHGVSNAMKTKLFLLAFTLTRLASAQEIAPLEEAQKAARKVNAALPTLTEGTADHQKPISTNRTW